MTTDAAVLLIELRRNSIEYGIYVRLVGRIFDNILPIQPKYRSLKIEHARKVAGIDERLNRCRHPTHSHIYLKCA